MFCPKCSQERASTETVFCTRCGFRLTEVADLVEEPRSSARSSSHLTPRKRGLRQSYFIFLLTFLFFTIGGLSQAFFRTDTRYFVIFSLIAIIAGIFRAVYALIFESNEKSNTSPERQFPHEPSAHQLQASPAEDYVKPDSLTSSTEPPASVTDRTTKQLLHNERES